MEQAAQIAFEHKSEEELDMVLSKCGTMNQVVAEKVHSLKSQLTGRR